MSKFISFFAVLLLLLFVITPAVWAREQRTTRVITVPVNQVITKDFYISGGDVVEISGTVNGDVIVGAGQLMIDGTVNGDVLVAGGMLDISGTVSEDARVAGGQINITGKIGRNLTVVGGDVNISENAEIVGGVVIGAGSVRLAGEIGGDVLIGAGNVTLSNVIGGDVEVYSGVLLVTSGANIGGDLVYTSEEEAEIDKQASISGQLLRKTPPVVGLDAEKKAKNVLDNLFAFNFKTKLISFLSALIVGLILIRLFPKYAEMTKGVLRDNPWKALLYGVLFLFITPFAVLALLITILGIPLALFGIMVLGTYFYLSKIFVANWLGAKIPVGDKKNAYLSFALGLAGFYLITSLPFIGGFLSFAAMFFGIGAGLLACKDFYYKYISSNAS